MDYKELNKELGNIDLYLLDQILKGRYPEGIKLLDAGCGEGRNLTYFINNGYDVYGLDPNPLAIKMLGMLAKHIDKHHFVTSTIEGSPFEEAMFDAIICSAVLHFAESHDHLKAMFESLSRMLKKGGTLFIRMTSDIGLNNKGEETSVPGVYLLPDGSTRYLITQQMIEMILDTYGYALLEPVKSVNVQGVRSMTTLMLQKL